MVMKRPVLSIVIPTFNRGLSLGLTLRSVLAQETSVAFEVLVVDNNSRDATSEIARSYDRVRYILERRQGLCYARNSGIENAYGDIIVFVDDDVIGHPGWLQALFRVYAEQPDAWCVGGKIILRLPGPPPIWFDESIAGISGYLTGLDRGDQTAKLSYPDDVWGANFSISRAALAKVGIFRTDLDRSGTNLLGGGETELCWRVQRAGGGVYYCGRAVVVHLVPPSRMSRAYFRRRAYWHGRSGRLLRMKRPPLKEILTLVAWEQARAVLGRPLNPASVFADTLRAWWNIGYIHQYLIDFLPAFRRPWSCGRRDKRDRDALETPETSF
jgi:glycosyltransferase involved in cell wall biosynthesis